MLITATERRCLWVGYSGGLDSTVLLHLLSKALEDQEADTPPCRVRALHVHHGLNPAANDWVEHCQKNCDHLQVPLHILYVDAKPSSDQSPEEAAREARFSAFKNFLGESDVLLLAHHQSDQAETILWRLLRGSGPLGLGGMAFKTQMGSLEILRPLLHVEKKSFTEYAKAHHLQWIEDPSNADPRFDRNFLRHHILPLITARWPKASAAIERSGMLCAQTAKALEDFAEPDLQLIQDPRDKSLSVKALLALVPARRAAVLRAWLKGQGYGLPSYDQMQRIDREILKAKGGSKPRLKIGSYEITRQRDILKVGLFANCQQ